MKRAPFKGKNWLFFHKTRTERLVKAYKTKKHPFSEIEKGIFIKFNWVIWKAENS